MSQAKRLDALESKIGYKFNDRDLLIRALTHSSFGDGRRKVNNYERLEFLGDRVLGLLTAETLFHQSKDDEGGLARKLNALVRKETCADVAMDLGLGDIMQISKSAEKQGGREKVSILGDLAESVLGAVFLDGGFEAAKVFYFSSWEDRISRVLTSSHKDPKTELQEKAAASRRPNPSYEVVDRSGPDHRPVFQIKVSVDGVGDAMGQGASKKDAERHAAQALLDVWRAL